MLVIEVLEKQIAYSKSKIWDEENENRHLKARYEESCRRLKHYEDTIQSCRLVLDKLKEENRGDSH